MGDFPGDGMAGVAVATAGRDNGLQVRNGRMAVGAITKMGYLNRCICGYTRVVTGHT